MAQVFPLNGHDPGGEPENPLAATLAALPDPWTLLLDRRIGEDMVDVVLAHPEIGIALVDNAPRDPAPAIAALRTRLDSERFGEFFPGDLAIVGLSVSAEELADIGDRLANAFDTAPRLTIDDRDWADAVIELLLEPGDLSMAPMAGQVPRQLRAAPRSAAEPAAALAGDAAQDVPVAETSPPPPLHLMAEWRPSAEERWSRRKWRWPAAAAAALILLAGMGLAWNAEEEDYPEIASSSPSQVELTLPPTLEAHRAPQSVAAAPHEPPPVPPRPLRVFAAKPMLPPPHPLPRLAYVEAPKFVAKETPAQTAKEQTAKETSAPAPAQTAETAPPPAAAAPSPASETPSPAKAPKPAPTSQAAKPEPEPAAKPAPPTRRVAAAPARAPQHPPERSDHPPIDAADLPPLDDVGPPEQTVQATPQREPPAQPPQQIGDTPPPPRIGPPIPLSRAPWQSQSGTSVPRTVAEGPKPRPADAPSASAGNGQECRPYTADTTLTGRNLPVRGMACRGADGQWRLVSELPVR